MTTASKTHRKHALVIGGARGIGEAIVRAFAAGGYALTIADRLVGEARALARELSAAGADAHAESADIVQAGDLHALVESVRVRTGVAGLDAAVNCVGIFDERRTTLKTDEASFRRLMEVNVVGAFLFSQAVEPLLGADAALIHIGSVNGILAGTELGAYKVSKAALHMLSRCLALELARDPRRIRVNVVAPGWVDTPGERLALSRSKDGVHPLDDPETAKWLPLGRRIEPQEIADMVVFLCSDKARSIAGQVLYVDGGQVI